MVLKPSFLTDAVEGPRSLPQNPFQHHWWRLGFPNFQSISKKLDASSPIFPDLDLPDIAIIDYSIAQITIIDMCTYRKCVCSKADSNSD